MTGSIHLWVEISFLEGQFANRNEFDIRNQLIDELDARGFGKFVGAGSGLGTMDFSFHVENEPAARQLLAQVIGDIAPEVNYTVDIAEDCPLPRSRAI
jgi:hypothetical protein